MGVSRVVKWWDRFWGALWAIGSAYIAFKTARWFATNASPADLGPLRYGLIGFAFLFGLLLGMAVLSLLTIGIMVALERLASALGHPFNRPMPADSGLLIAPKRVAPEDRQASAASIVEPRPAPSDTGN